MKLIITSTNQHFEAEVTEGNYHVLGTKTAPIFKGRKIKNMKMEYVDGQLVQTITLYSKIEKDEN